MKIDANDFARDNGPEHLKKELQRMENESKPINPASTKPETSWPAPLHSDAFHGLAGNIIRTIAPYTEADPAAMLACLLVAFGNCIGRSAYFEVGAVKHNANLFLAIVGKTSTGRKGTAWHEMRRFFQLIQDEWLDRIVNGLSTGEGLIEAVRDASEGDIGQSDKRLLAFEAEFSKLLKQGERKGNTLSEVCRGFWESGTAQSVTRNNPLKATDAHVSIAACITEAELKRHLTENDCLNGFGNRFFWVCANRSQILPMPGNPPQNEIVAWRSGLNQAIEFAQSAGFMVLSDAAQDIWGRERNDETCLYAKLTKGGPALSDMLCARAAPMVLRIAMIYALLDLKKFIEPEHLRAALAVWRYAEDSVRYVFGDALGDAIADMILEELRDRPRGMTRTEIRAFFKNNKTSAEITRALTVLQTNGKASVTMEPGDGRPSERWFATE